MPQEPDLLTLKENLNAAHQLDKPKVGKKKEKKTNKKQKNKKPPSSWKQFQIYSSRMTRTGTPVFGVYYFVFSCLSPTNLKTSWGRCLWLSSSLCPRVPCTLLGASYSLGKWMLNKCINESVSMESRKIITLRPSIRTFYSLRCTLRSKAFDHTHIHLPYHDPLHKPGRSKCKIGPRA